MTLYRLTVDFESADRLPTWDIIEGTPAENARGLLELCLKQSAEAEVVSFKLERDGKPLPACCLEGATIEMVMV